MASSKKTARKKASRKAPEPAAPPSNSLEKVKELLFGQERQTQIEQTSKVETTLTKRMQAMQSALEKAQTAAEAHWGRRFENLEVRISQDQTTRRKQQEALSKRISKLSETVDEKVAMLRKRIEKSSEDSLIQLDAYCTELREDLQSEIQDLRTETADQSTLAGAFESLAKKLRRP